MAKQLSACYSKFSARRATFQAPGEEATRFEPCGGRVARYGLHRKTKVRVTIMRKPTMGPLMAWCHFCYRNARLSASQITGFSSVTF
ncbi:hypothetical protein TNCT_518661 [Trichonephila clavata]|uniref:Uncharacterized protein n=1 Tax=Trichonephila clavata TaxID=2740835 RepID=A0A8X6LGJ4_TRICU|nr:hypothetical protein TNCT_518661 [Trichonephila clavata]